MSPITRRGHLVEALALEEAVWEQLLTRSGATSPFLTRDWYSACAEATPALSHAGDSRGVVLQRSATGELEALLPFRVQRDSFWGVPVPALGWAFGDLGCPDHLDILASPEADLDALVVALERIPWVVIRLDSVAATAHNVARFLTASERRGWVVRRRGQGRCLYIDLPESWETYLSGLSAHARQAIRRLERKLCREHDVHLTDYVPGRLEEGLKQLHRLHALRWGGGGAFDDPVVTQLHRRFAASLAARDEVWLVTLDVDGTPAAAWYGFLRDDTVYHYQSGRDPRWERDRVGSVLIGIMIRRAIEAGYRKWDFLRGEEPYKMEWTQTARPYDEVLVFRSGWRGAALRMLDRIERPLRGRGLRGVLHRAYRWPADLRRRFH